LYKTDYHKELHPLTALEVAVINENAIVSHLVASRKNYLLVKRTTDMLFSSLFIVLVLSWLLPIVAVWIRLDSKGPVFFVQKRIGLNGKIFRCLKLRTMIKNDDADEKPAEENDDRITRAGKFLRRTNIDELPQFFNILIGDMSLIGPRPHMIADCIRFSSVIPSYKFRSLVKPGITGLAQIKGYRGPAKDHESITNRYYWDAVYVRKAGLWLEVKIICKTIARGIYNLATVFSDMVKKRNRLPQAANSSHS
jgi:putative colanic acid biosysnthesis UDP-glucose lipid carrier transferase